MNIPDSLLPAAQAAGIPPVYSQDGDSNPLVRVRWFCTANRWVWLCTEASAVLYDDSLVSLGCVADWGTVKDVLCFGVVHGWEREWGYWTLSDFLGVGGYVELDSLFAPVKLSEVEALESLQW